jgi:hypothetical protein
MKNKIDYCIEDIEKKTNKYFSTYKYDSCSKDFIDTLKKNCNVLFSINDSSGFSEIFMKTKHPFYFHFKKDMYELFNTNIYFYEESNSELNLYLKLLKNIK